MTFLASARGTLYASITVALSSSAIILPLKTTISTSLTICSVRSNQKANVSVLGDGPRLLTRSGQTSSCRYSGNANRSEISSDSKKRLCRIKNQFFFKGVTELCFSAYIFLNLLPPPPLPPHMKKAHVTGCEKKWPTCATKDTYISFSLELWSNAYANVRKTS